MIFIIILLIIVCIALVFIVLIQNPKGGGLVSEFSSANQIIGVQKSTDTIEKITWGLASFLFVLCLASTLVGSPGDDEKKTDKKSQIESSDLPISNAPQLPGGQPQTPEQQPTQPE